MKRFPIKLKDILENKILIPRRSKEERQKNLAAVHYRQIQEYIKNGSKGNLDLEGTPLKTLPPNLTEVGGSIYLEESQITSLGDLEYVGGDLWLYYSQIISLGNLTHVGGDLYLNNTPITSLGNLKYVGSGFGLRGTPITSLGNLEYVGGNLDLNNTQISETYTEEQIRKQVKIMGRIYR